MKLFSWLGRLLIFLQFYMNFVMSSVVPVSIRNLDTVNGRKTYYQFGFNYDQTIVEATAGIRVTFPSEIPSSLFERQDLFECYFKVSYSHHDKVLCNYQSNGEVYIQVGKIYKGYSSFTIGPIQNPTLVKGTAQFKLCVMYNDYPQSCEDNFGQVTFNGQPILMKSAQLSQISSIIVSEGSSWLFDFELNGVYQSKQFYVRISFPEGFTTNNAGCEILDLVSRPQAEVLFNERQVECKSISKVYSGQQQIRIINMVNPPDLIFLNNFSIQILQESTSQILEEINFSTPYQIQAGKFKIRYESDNQFKYSNTTYAFYIIPQSLLDQNTFVEIKFGLEWNLYQKNCTVVRGFQRIINTHINCYLDPYLNRYIIDNYNSSIYQNEILITIPLQTPQYQGTYPVQVNSYSKKNQIIDQGSVNIAINATYGSLREYRVHPMLKQVKLKAGEVGPLEFTFFLKTLLPSTNYRSKGKFMVHITPPLNIPNPATDGVLKCLFYKTVLSAFCDIQNTGGYSVLTVYTPEGYDFQESEVPITITTEGAKNGRADGFQLDPLVQRYLLNFLTYTHYLPGPAPTLPVEGYFQEWIPDPFEIPDADIEFDLTTTDSLEPTHLIFKIKKFPKHVTYWTSLVGRRYFFKITFINDNIAPSLKWSFSTAQYGTERIVEIPCLVYNNNFGRVKYNLKCELVRRDSIRNPFIQISEVDKTLLDNLVQDFVIEIPKIQIGDVLTGANVLKSYLRLSFIEDTPGMIDDFVEVYYKDFSFIVTPINYITSPYQNNAVFSTQLTVNKPTDLKFLWTSASSNLSYVIYEIDQQCFDIQISGFTPDLYQTLFAKNAQYLLVDKSLAVPSFAVTDELKSVIINCYYSYDFTFKVTSFRNRRVIEKYNFIYHVSPAHLQIASPFYEFKIRPNPTEEQDINNVIRINEEHQFYLIFQVETELKAYKSIIIITMVNNNYIFVIPVTNIFYCKIVGLQNLIIGQSVKCTRKNSNTIEITNFDLVPASTSITIDFRLLILSENPQPLISIETKYIYSPSQSYLVDYAYSKNPTAAIVLTPNYDTLQTFQVADTQFRYEKRPPNFVGPLYFWFDLINLSPPISLKEINIVIPSQFSYQRNLLGTNQPLKCTINNVRFVCTSNVDPTGIITVKIQMDLINTFTNAVLPKLNEMIITTEYVSPTEGFKHPSLPGFYALDVTVIDQALVTLKSTRYIKIRSSKVEYFHVTHVIRNAGFNNLFQFTFQLNAVTPVPDYSLGGRIQFELQTTDNKGNNMFDRNLGNSYQTGDYLGCRVFSTPTIPTIDSNTKCRIQVSQMNPNSVIIELVSFPAIPVSTKIDIDIARIQNPSFFNEVTNQIMDTNINLNIYDLTNPKGSLYFDYFNLFMDLRVDPFLTYTHDMVQQNLAGGRMPWNSLTVRVNQLLASLFVDLAGKTNYIKDDYYVIELPNTGIDTFQVSSVVCTDPNYICKVYLEINWIIIQFVSPAAFSSLSPLEIKIKQIPESISRVDILFKAHIWSQFIYDTQVIHIIYASQSKKLMGAIKNGSITILGSLDKQIKDKTNVPIRVKIEIENRIPTYGAIQIIFNSDNVRVHGHCKSSLNFAPATVLLSSETIINGGSIGCKVQSGVYSKLPGDYFGDITAIPSNGGKYTSWVISGFKEIPSTMPINTIIYIDGFVDFQALITFSTDDFYAYTYGTSLEDPIIETGRFIDSYYLTLPIPTNALSSLANYESFNANKYDFLHTEVKPVRGGDRTPLKLVFSLTAGTKVQAYLGRIRFRLNGGNQLQEQTILVGTPLIETGVQYACQLYELNDIIQDTYIGCSIISQIEINPLTVKDRATEFVIIPNSELVSSKRYQFVLTTAHPITEGAQDVYGIKFPLAPFTYKIELSMCQACNSLTTGFSMWQDIYFQIYGLPLEAEVISYINIPGNWNIFTLNFKAAALIDKDTQRLVIELPTASLKTPINTQPLFQDDLGLNLQNLDEYPCDLLETLSTTQVIKCTLIKGNNSSLQPAKILVSFSDSIAVNQVTKIAFRIINPVIQTIAPNDLASFFIPVQVYIEDVSVSTSKISQWTIIENAFYIHSKNAPIAITLTDVAYTSGNSDCDTLTDIKIQFQNLAQPLKFVDKDAYLIQVNPALELIDDKLQHLLNSKFTSGNPTFIAFLVKCKGIMIFPSAAEDIVSTKIVETLGNSIHIPPYSHPNPTYVNLLGYACYVQKRITDSFNFLKIYPVTTPQILTGLNPTAPVVDFNIQAKDLYGGKYVSTDRQNYIFQVTFDKWINVSRVGVMFDLKNWKTDLKPDPTSICQEEKDSEIHVRSCHLATLPAPQSIQFALLWVDIFKYTVAGSHKLIFSTSYDAFQPIQSDRSDQAGLTTPATAIDGDTLDPARFQLPLSIPKEFFTVKLYGQNIDPFPNFGVITGYANDYACYISQFPTGGTTDLDTQVAAGVQKIPQSQLKFKDLATPPNTYTVDYSLYKHNQNIRAWYPYHRYNDEFVSCLSTDKSPIRFEIRPPNNIPSAISPTGPLNKIIIDLTDITLPVSSKKTDLIKNKLICYINDIRVKCTSASNKLTLEFFVGFSTTDRILVYVSASNDEDITQEGVQYTGTNSFYRWKYQLQDYTGALNYSGLSEYFPVKHRSILGGCPYKSIFYLSIGISSNIVRPNWYLAPVVLFFNMSLANTNEITGFRILFRNYDETSTAQNDDYQFLNIQSGGKYPCYRGAPSLQKDISCILERDTTKEFTIIHVFNLKTVGPSEKISLLIGQMKLIIQQNIIVQVMGGEKTFDAPTGKSYLGETSHVRMRQNSWNCDTNLSNNDGNFLDNYDPNPVINGCQTDLPSPSAPVEKHILYSNRLDYSQFYLFESTCALGSPGTVVIEVLIRDSGEEYDMCTANLTENQNWFDCDPFTTTNVKCNVQKFLREEGQGPSYKKKMYIYVDFESLDTANFSQVVFLPVGLIQCRETGKNKNGNYRFLAYWYCGHPTKCCKNNFRQDYIAYVPCYRPIAGVTTCNIQTLGTPVVTFHPLYDHSDYSASIASLPGYLTYTSFMLNGAIQNGSMNIGLKQFINNFLVPAGRPLIPKFGYQLAIQIDPASISGVTMQSFCLISGGVGNWDRYFYSREVQCSLNFASLIYYVDNFTDLTNDYIRLLIKLTANSAVVPSMTLKIFLYQNPIPFAPPNIDNTEPIFFMSKTILGEYPIVALNSVSPNYVESSNIQIQNKSITPGQTNFDLKIGVSFPTMFSTCFYKSYSITIDVVGADLPLTLAKIFNDPTQNCLSGPVAQGIGSVRYSVTIGYSQYNVANDVCSAQAQSAASGGWTNLSFRFLNEIYNRKREWFISVVVHGYLSNVCGSGSQEFHYYFPILFQSVMPSTPRDYGLLATTVSIDSLTRSANMISELQLNVDGLNYNIGQSDNTILVLEPINHNNSNAIQPPVDSILFFDKTPINCMCYYFDTATNKFLQITDLMCIRIVDKTFYYYSIHIYVYNTLATPFTKMRCYIPEFQNNSVNDIFQFKIIEPGLYTRDFTNLSYQAITYSSQVLTYTPYTATLPLIFSPSPPNFFGISAPQETNSLVDQYKIDILTTNNLHKPYIYLRHTLLGPTVDNSLCSKVGAWVTDQIRAYSTHNNVIICQSDLTNNNEFIIESHTVRVNAGIPKNYYSNTVPIVAYELQVINSDPNPSLQLTLHNTVNMPFTKPTAHINLYSPVGMKVSLFYLNDNRARNQQILHSMKFELNGGFTKFDIRTSSFITITNSASQLFGLTCFAESMESSFLEDNVTVSPSQLRVHVCRVSAVDNIIYVVDEDYSFPGDRKFYIYFSMYVPSNLSSATFTMRYASKYKFDVAGQDYTFESARGQDTVTYDVCLPGLSGCILPHYHRTFPFYVKRFINGQYTMRFFVYHDQQISDGYQTFRAITDSQYAANYVGIVRRYGVNGSIRNYVERYLNTQTIVYATPEIYFSGDIVWPIITTPGQYLEFYVKILSGTLFGGTKTVSTSSNPAQSIILSIRILVVASGSPNNNQVVQFYDQAIWYRDFSTNVQSSNLRLDKFYYTNTRPGEITSLYFRFLIISPLIAPKYPQTYFEFIFPQLDILKVSIDKYSIMNCEVLLNDALITKIPPRNELPRCRAFMVEYENQKVLVIRVEDVNSVSLINSISFAFDIKLPNPTQAYQPLDLIFDYYFTDQISLPYYQYQKMSIKFVELILVDTMNPPFSALQTQPSLIVDVIDKKYGSTNVDHIWNLSWKKTTTGYEQTNRPGEKIELRFTNGIVFAQNNNVSILKYYFNDVLQTPLWFSRSDQVIFFSPPNLNVSVNLKLKIIADNLWAYQRDQYNTALNILHFTVYDGVPQNYDGKYQRSDIYFPLQQLLFNDYIERTLDFTTIEISTDNFPDSQIVSQQRITMKFELQNQLTALEMDTRKVDQIRIKFDSGVKKVERCYFKTPIQNKAHINQNCQVEYDGTLYSINYRGIRFYDINFKNYIVYAQLIVDNSPSITYSIYQIVDNPNSSVKEVEAQSLLQSFTLPSFTVSSSSIILDFMYSKHFPLYYELYQVQYFANRYPVINKLRFRVKLPAATTQAAGNNLQITIPASIIPTNAYTLFNPANELQCTLYEELTPLTQYDVHKLSSCTFAGGVLTLDMPESDLYISKYYMVNVEERYVHQGFFMPTTFTKNEFNLELKIGGASYKDTTYQQSTQQFTTFSIKHFTITANNYDMLTVSFIPQTTLAQSNLLIPQETFVLLELESQYFMEDIGLLEPSGVYQSDDLPDFLNGRSISCILKTAGVGANDCKLIVHFGKKIPISPTIDVEQSMIQFVLYEFTQFNPGVQYDLLVPLIKIPSDVNTSIQTRLSFILIKNDLFITQETSFWINYIKVKADTSTNTPFSVNLNSNEVQSTTSQLNFNFGTNYALNFNANNFLLKWDNNLIGIKGDDIKNLGAITPPNSCEYNIFKQLNLIFISKYVTPANPTPAQCTFMTFNTEHFVQPYGFQFVYVNSIPSSETIYKPNSASLKSNLAPKLDLNAKFNYISGFTSQFSVSRYVVKLDTPQYVPLGSRIEINLQSNLQTFEERCIVLSGLQPINLITNTLEFNSGSLECQKLTQKIYVVSGFSEINTGPITVEIEIFVQSLTSVNINPIISAKILKYYKGSFYEIINYTPIISPQLHSGLGMAQLSQEDKIEIKTYSNDWSRISYKIKLRNQDLTRNNSKEVILSLPPLIPGYDYAIDPYVQFYSKYLQSSEFFYEYNSRNFVQAQCSILTSPPPTKRFQSKLDFIPKTYPTPQTFYDILHNQDVVMMIDSNTVAPLNTHPTLQYQIERKAIYIPQPEYYIFQVQTISNLVPLQYEQKYYEVFVKPREDLDDKFRITPVTAEAGAINTLILEFKINTIAVALDEIWLEFPTYDGVRDVFTPDLGLSYDALNVIQCSYTVSPTYTNPTTVNQCILELGIVKQISSPARIRIVLLTGANLGDEITIIIPHIKNPMTPTQFAGITLKVMNKCSDHGPLLCIVYHAQHSYEIKTASVKTSLTCSFGPNPLTVSDDYLSTPPSLHHLITTPSPTSPVTSIPAGSFISFVYPLNHVQDKQSCSFAFGPCIYYNAYNTVLIKLTSSFLLSNPFEIFNLQNGIHRWETSLSSTLRVYIYQNNVIDLFYSCQMTKYEYYYPIIPSPPATPQVCGTMINTQTVNPLYFLRENYVNVAKISVYGLYRNRHVNYYRINKPTEVNKFIENYCYATLELLNILTAKIENIIQECTVYDSFIILRKLDTIPYDETKYNFKEASITIYFKFIIDNQIPTVDIAAKIVLYSCVGQCYDILNQSDLKDYLHVGKCTIDWTISYLRQPNLATAGFYKVPYYLRQARINQQVEFQMLIRPRTFALDYQIDRFVFVIPDEFQFPPQQQFDNCLIQGTINLNINDCSLIRRDGQTRLTLIPINYDDNSVKIVTLSNKLVSRLFTAPPYPGQYFQMKIEMYSGSQLVETQFMNVTEVIGTTFFSTANTAYFNIINPLNQLTNEIFQFTFALNDVILPIGYLRDEVSTDQFRVYSNIRIIFDWVGGGWNIHNGYLRDLGTGLPDGALLGCQSKELIVKPQNKLRCILKHGINAEYMPNIIISGYEELTQLNQAINIYVTNLQSLILNQLMTIKIGIETIYPDMSASGYLYQLTPFLPAKTVASSTELPETMTVTVSTVPKVYGITTYGFTITITPVYPTHPTIDTNDLIGFKFPPNFIGKYQPILNTDPNTFVFPESDSIYVRYIGIPSVTTLSLNIQSISNPDFQMMKAGSYNVEGVILDSQHKIKYKMNGLIPPTHTIAPFSDIPFVTVQAIESISGGDTNVTYEFTFITGHYIPPNGSISFFFPDGVYTTLMSMYKGCSLSGDEFEIEFNNSFCNVEIDNRLDIILVDTLLSPVKEYKVKVFGINNPNIPNTSLYQFIMQTYYTNQPSLEQVIGRKPFAMPFLLYFSPFQCNMQVNTQYNQVLMKSIYSFIFRCDGIIRFKSDMFINLPYQYGLQNNLGTYLCLSHEENTLFSQSCPIINNNGILKIKVQLKQILAKTSFSINIALNNPSEQNNLYQFSAGFQKDTFQYAATLNSLTLTDMYVSIISDPNIIKALPSQTNVEIKMFNIPLNSGEPATYIFMIPQTQFNKDVLLTEIFFPTSFSSQLGNDLECSLLQSDLISLSFDLPTLLFMRRNITNNHNPISSYFKVPCKINQNHILSIEGISQYLNDKSKKYNYFIIKNIMNPGDSLNNKFKIIHSSEGYVLWIFEDKLNYTIVDHPDRIDIISIDSSEQMINTLSTYQFKLKQRTESNVISNFGILIELPDQYDLISQPDSISCTLTIDSTKSSPCQLYNEFILIQDQSTKINTLSQQLSISKIFNPSIEDVCSQNYSEIKKSTFTFKIYDISKNIVVSTSKPQDQKQCLAFSSDKLLIKMKGPTNLVRGLSYSYTIEIERPADSISFEPYIDDKNIIFNPNIITFEKFEPDTAKSFEVLVKYGAKLGNHLIRLRKVEYTRINQFEISPNAEEIYSSSPTIQIKIDEFDERKQTRPSIVIDDFIDYGRINSEFIIYGRVTKKTSEQFKFEVTFSSTLSTKISVKPQQILINENIQTFNFTVKYLDEKIIEPIKLNFGLTSIFSKTLVYRVIPEYKWLVFTISTIHKPQNILRVSLQNNNPPINLYKPDLGKQIYDPIKIKSEQLPNSEKILLPKILTTIQSELSNSHSIIEVITSCQCKLYYILTLQNSFIPESIIVKEGIYQDSKQLAYGTSQLTRRVGDKVEYSGKITIEELEGDTNYNIMAICENPFGLSQNVYVHSFQTLPNPNGVVITLSLNGFVQSSTLLTQLEKAFRLQKGTLTIITPDSLINKQLLSSPLIITYQIVIQPYTKTKNNILKYISSYIQDPKFYTIFQKYIPQLINPTIIPVSYLPYTLQAPKFAQDPILLDVGFYDAIIKVKMWEQSIVYAQVVEKTQNMYNNQVNNTLSQQNYTIITSKEYSTQQLISQQVILGVDQRNQEINQNWIIKVKTDPTNNEAIINLDDLKDGSSYDVYISATNIMPYNDEYLFTRLSNSNIKKISFTTNYNYNIDYCQMLKDVYSMNPKLAQALKRKMDHDPKATYCYTFTKKEK